MKRRIKWISIVVLIGCLAFLIAPFARFLIFVKRDLNSMEASRKLLLYETDHQELIKACRELSGQVVTGKLKLGSYQIHGNPDAETRQFPQLILDLDPLRVDIKENGHVDIMMSPLVMYGVYAFTGEYEGSLEELFRSADGVVTAVELIDGLWYYDEDFRKNPEHKKEVEELLKKRKAQSLSGES